METLPLGRAFTLIEPGPVVLVSTHDGKRPNVMTISWTMVLDFSARFAITTGPWNHSFAALSDQRDCVISIPGAGMLDTVIGIGTCSGRKTDKFARFGLRALRASKVTPPLIGGCLAHIECRVEEIIAGHDIVILQGLAAHLDPGVSDRRLIHAVGDGTFTADGEHFDRRALMRAKLPEGV
ncbi:MAG: flavin reductase family protein [Paenirhodobacter sp.]|uniref:flavin reductase family protein n=1 Tax=Paenirhodobacter sp. TaxID=1965326 RepID=UPI003D0C1E48